MQNRLVIIQNYFTPYRNRLFEEISTARELHVIYLHHPEDEGRKWNAPDRTSYVSVHLNRIMFGPLVLYDFVGLHQYIHRGDTVLFLDNLPTNILMFFSIIFAPVRFDHKYIWQEQVAVSYGDNLLKLFYRYVTTWVLLHITHRAISLSRETTAHLSRLAPDKKGAIIQARQATFTKNEILAFKKESVRNKSKRVVSFGYLGYYKDRKGIQDILSVFSELNDVDIRMIFHGAGELEGIIKSASEQDCRITERGYLHSEKEKTDFFNSIHVLLVPSKKEPWGLVVNEAATRGVPSIVTTEVGAKEFVEQVWDNAIVPVGDKKSLQQAMERVIDLVRKGDYRAVTERAFDVANKYSIEEVARTFINL